MGIIPLLIVFVLGTFNMDMDRKSVHGAPSKIDQGPAVRNKRYIPSDIPIFDWDCCCHQPWSIFKPWALTGSWCCALPIFFSSKCVNKCWDFVLQDIRWLGDSKEKCGKYIDYPNNPPPHSPPMLPPSPPPMLPPPPPPPSYPICLEHMEVECCFTDMTGMGPCNDPGYDKTMPPCCLKGPGSYCCGVGCMCGGSSRRAGFGRRVGWANPWPAGPSTCCVCKRKRGRCCTRRECRRRY